MKKLALSLVSLATLASSFGVAYADSNVNPGGPMIPAGSSGSTNSSSTEATNSNSNVNPGGPMIPVGGSTGNSNVNPGGPMIPAGSSGSDGSTTSNSNVNPGGPMIPAVIPTNSYAVSYHGQVVAQPNGFIKDGTTYMSVNDVVKALKAMNLNANWSTSNLIIGNPLPMDVPSMPSAGNGKARIYIDGNLYATVPYTSSSDSSTHQIVCYVPVWYVMQGLRLSGQNSHWDGHQWTF